MLYGDLIIAFYFKYPKDAYRY